MKHRHSVTENPSEVAGIAAIAAAIGATVAMLFTPRTGGQVRRGILRRAEHAKDDVEQRLIKTTDVAEKTAKNAKDRAVSTGAKVKSDTKSTAAKVKTDAKSTTTKVRRDSKKTKADAGATTRTARTNRRTPTSRS